MQEDGVKSLRTSAVCGTALAVVTALLIPIQLLAQQADSAPADPNTAVRELQDEVRQLRGLIDQMRAENAESRAEMQQLRQDLQSTRTLLEQSTGKASVQAGPEQAATQAQSELASQGQGIDDRVKRLEDSTALLASKVDEQYQTKVETASKYRARLHGIVLMNTFRNVGGTNSIDLPDFSEPPAPGSARAVFGATLRQSQIGLEVFGPTIAGARTSADVQFDFAGGFPATGNGVDFGIVRLQTASMRMDWEHTSLVAGQDSLFISPLTPTSFASLATPTFGYAGNLWAWTPQIRAEHRFALSDQQTFTVQAGILDNLNWGFPPDEFYRYPQAGESSGQPAFASRAAWSHQIHGHPLSFAAAGYYGRQNWNWNRYTDAWAGMADWQIPIVSRVSISGEFYRGRGIGGLGAAVGRSIVIGSNPAVRFPPIRGLDAIGGWSQLKVQITPKIELNGVVSQDNAYAGDVRGFAINANNFGPILGRNRGALGNFVFRPRSDLLFSAELRRLESFPIYSGSSSTNQVNLAVGILF
jgi:hypothetical protein